MKEDRLNKINSIFLLLTMGILLIFVRLGTIFLPASNFFEAILFGSVAYFLGNYVYHAKWTWGVFLAFPAIVVLFYIEVQRRDADLDFNINNIVSCILDPLVSCLGIWLKNRKYNHQTG
jgi:predicted membrane channel-forming protein YqfA (hemolysin III family)